MTLRSFLLVVCSSLLLMPVCTRADVKMRPGDKPKESTKDFVKDAKKNGYPTPEPHDRTFTFTAGLSVEVTLDAASSFLGSMKFSIRDAPLYGKLSEFRPHPSGDSNKVLVTYTHGGDPEQLTDKFTFQVKIGDGNTSAPGTISLFGKRAAPKLEVLETPQFRRLQPGEQDAGRIVLLNSGTAPFAGQIVWPEPFIGPPNVELAINEKQTLMLMIKPMKPGAYRVSQELQPGVPSSKVQAYVECVQAFSASPGTITLAFDPAKNNRSGVVKVANASDSPLELKLDFPKRLKVPTELTIPAKSTQDVTVELEPQDVAMFHGEVWFVQEPHREKVIVHAEAEPAQIKLESPANGVLDFGKIEKGKAGEARISVMNVGGTPAVLKLNNVPPFTSPAAATSVTIEAGKSQTIAIAFTPEQPGTFNAVYTIGGNAGKVDVAVKGVMFDPKRPAAGTPVSNPNLVPTRSRPTEAPSAKTSKKAEATPPPAMPVSLSSVPRPTSPAPAPAAAPTPATESSSTESPGKNGKISIAQLRGNDLINFSHLATYGLGLEILPQYKSNILDAVPAIGVHEAGRNHIVLAWMAPKVEPKQYLVQTSYLLRNETTGIPLKSWRNVENWKPVTAPAGVVAGRIDGLEPNTEYEWRILGMDHEGKFSPASDLLRVATLPPFSLPAWAWMMIVGALVAIGVFMFRRLQEQRMLGVG